MSYGWIKHLEYWQQRMPEDDGDIEIHPCDQFTKMECRRYGIDYDPDAKFGLYTTFDSVPEHALESLHFDLDDAKRAGEKRWASLIDMSR